MTHRIVSKMGNHGTSAYKLRESLEFMVGGDTLISIDEFQNLVMAVCGIIIDLDELLALYGLYDVEASGYIDMREIMGAVMDKDHFEFYLGKDHFLTRELTQVTETDKLFIAALLDKVETPQTSQPYFIALLLGAAHGGL